jgi:hypothetical protein
MSRRTVLALAFLGLGLAACRSSSAASERDASTDAQARTEAGVASDGGATTTTSGTAGAIGSTAPASDAGLAEDLALPAATSDELTLRARHLFEAIAADNPDLGSDMLFPRDAWMSSRDANDPGKQWDAKTASGFRRAVHALHKRTKGIERAKFVSFEIGRTVTQATPRHKEWRLPIWESHRGHITFTLDGRTMRWDVAELAAWRGAWYLTRLR